MSLQLFYAYDLKLCDEVDDVDMKINCRKRKYEECDENLQTQVSEVQVAWLRKLQYAYFERNTERLRNIFHELELVFQNDYFCDAWKYSQCCNNLPLLKMNDECIHFSVEVMAKFMTWVLDHMFFGDSKFELKIVVDIMKHCNIHVLPINFFGIMISLNCIDVVKYIFEEYIPKMTSISENFKNVGCKHLFDVNQMDVVSSGTRLFGSSLLLGHTPLTLAIHCASEKVKIKKCNDDSKELQTKGLHCSILDIILEKPELNVNQPNGAGWTPLCIAIQQRKWDIVRALLHDFGANPALASKILNHLRFPMEMAVEQENLELVKDLYILTSKELEDDENLFLHDVVVRGDISVLEMFFSETKKETENYHEKNNIWMFDFNRRDKMGNTVLHYAVNKERSDIFQILFDMNKLMAKIRPSFAMDVSVQNNCGYTILHTMMEKILFLIDQNNRYTWWDYEYILRHIFDMICLKNNFVCGEDWKVIVKKVANLYNTNGETCLHILTQGKLYKFHGQLNHGTGDVMFSELEKKKMNMIQRVAVYLIEVFKADFNCGIKQYNKTEDRVVHTRLASNEEMLEPYERRWGKSALMLAIQNHNIALFRYLLTEHRYTIDIMQRDFYGNTLIHVVVIGSVYYFHSLEYIALDNFRFFHENDPFFGVLIFNARNYLLRELDVIWKEQKRVVDISFKRLTPLLSTCSDFLGLANHDKQTALHILASHGAYTRPIPAIKFFIKENGVRCDVQDLNGNTALMVALMNNRDKIGFLNLLTSGIQMYALNKLNRNIFHMIGSKMQDSSALEMCQNLVKNKNISTWTPSAILNKKAVNIKDDEKRKIIARLINTKDNHGNTPLYYAIKQGNKELAICYLQLGAHWYGTNNIGFGVLHYADGGLMQYLEEKFIWKAKMDVFSEVLGWKGNKKCNAHVLNADILNVIFSMGFKK